MSSIEAKGVSVAFPLYGGSARFLRSRIMSSATGGRVGSDKRSRTVVQALENIDLSVRHGERVALIGHNGAGKTTLLRVLSGIYPPLTGNIRIEGRVAPIFDIGLGMDPDATGYDNIRVRGLYLGLSRRQVEAKVAEIAEFTELGPFLDMPMRTYSAGMQTRLSFAVSTSVDPEILLLDEGIGAGDAHFMERANERLRGFVERSGILILASHDAGLLSRLCERAVRLEHGRIVDDGPFDGVMARFAEDQRLGQEVADREAREAGTETPPIS